MLRRPRLTGLSESGSPEVKTAGSDRIGRIGGKEGCGIRSRVLVLIKLRMSLGVAVVGVLFTS